MGVMWIIRRFIPLGAWEWGVGGMEMVVGGLGLGGFVGRRVGGTPERWRGVGWGGDGRGRWGERGKRRRAEEETRSVQREIAGRDGGRGKGWRAKEARRGAVLMYIG